MSSLKLSISLPESDVAALDRYAESAGLDSRSAAIRHAISLLSDRELQDDYADAFDEWEASGDAEAWGLTVADGLDDAPR